MSFISFDIKRFVIFHIKLLQWIMKKPRSFNLNMLDSVRQDISSHKKHSI